MSNVSLDYEQTLFLFRFSNGKARARERRSRETLETRAAPSRAISLARGHLRVSRFARRTTEKRETARSLMFHSHADISVNFTKPFFFLFFLFFYFIYLKKQRHLVLKSVAEKTITFSTEKYWSSQWSSNLLLDQCFCE